MIHKGKNLDEREEIKPHDSIVSHVSYPLMYYEKGVHSTLTLTEAKLTSIIQLKFHRLSFSAGCIDYLAMGGATSHSQEKLTVCMRNPSLLDKWTEYIIISNEVSFHFVSKSKTGGLGFQFEYRGRYLYLFVQTHFGTSSCWNVPRTTRNFILKVF